MRPFLLALALWTSAAAAVGAQRNSVAAGDRVRITAPPQSGTYTVAEASAEGLVLRGSRETGLVRVTAASLRRIEVRVPRTRGRGAARGAGIGALAGAVTGAVATVLSGEVEEGDCIIEAPTFEAPNCRRTEPSVAGGAAAGAILGAGAGALLGYFRPGSRWQPLPLPARVGVAPTATGVALSLTATFQARAGDRR